jgi:hypothetical protein
VPWQGYRIYFFSWFWRANRGDNLLKTRLKSVPALPEPRKSADLLFEKVNAVALGALAGVVAICQSEW